MLPNSFDCAADRHGATFHAIRTFNFFFRNQRIFLIQFKPFHFSTLVPFVTNSCFGVRRRASLGLPLANVPSLSDRKIQAPIPKKAEEIMDKKSGVRASVGTLPDPHCKTQTMSWSCRLGWADRPYSESESKCILVGRLGGERQAPSARRNARGGKRRRRFTIVFSLNYLVRSARAEPSVKT